MSVELGFGASLYVGRRDLGIDTVFGDIAPGPNPVRGLQALVDRYECEWKAVVEDPAKRKLFRLSWQFGELVAHHFHCAGTNRGGGASSLRSVGHCCQA